MSTTPLLQSPVHSLADPALLPTYEVYLHRYILSYSASCPCLVQPIVQLFEKLLLPRWVSHYAISIRGNSSFSHNSGDRKFELRRVGYLPFGSVAFFTITDNGFHGNDLDEEETAPLIRAGAKSIWRDEKIGTTFFRPDDIIHEIQDQDKIYEMKNVNASNSLLDVPREYSLLQANCQHFILELIRRIGVFDEGDVYEELEKASRLPRTWCRFLLSMLGVLVNSVFVYWPLEPMTCTVVYMYHLCFSLVMTQDYTMRKLRVELEYNERRFLHRSHTHRLREVDKRTAMSNDKVLVMLSLCMASPLSYGALRLFSSYGAWTVGIFLITIPCYYAYVFVAARILLDQIKCANAITSMRDRNREARVEEAYDTLKRRWNANEIQPPCPEAIWWQSEPCDRRCRKCFLDKARGEQVYDDDTSFGPLDFEAAVARWESKHQRPIDIRRSYVTMRMSIFYAVVVILYMLNGCTYALYVNMQSSR